jgi:hypothetical protein
MDIRFTIRRIKRKIVVLFFAQMAAQRRTALRLKTSVKLQ